MKANALSCTTNRAGWRGCVTSVCCALWWLTVHLPGHVKELTIAESAKRLKSRLSLGPPPCVLVPCIIDRDWKCFCFFLELSLAEKTHLARCRGQMGRNVSFIKIITHARVLSRSSVAQSLSILMMFWNREKPLHPLWEGRRGEQLTEPKRLRVPESTGF